jgi:hypothetical protein
LVWNRVKVTIITVYEFVYAWPGHAVITGGFASPGCPGFAFIRTIQLLSVALYNTPHSRMSIFFDYLFIEFTASEFVVGFAAANEGSG